MRALVLLLALAAAGCLNPFAPGRDDSPAAGSCDPTTIPGIFQCFQAAYTFHDTSAYGPLLADNFVFVYRDYDRGIDVTWGRDDEMRTSYGLFHNTQRLDLIWNNIVSSTQDSNQMNVVRGFNLTITFNPTDVERVDGYANLTFIRSADGAPWKILRWRDESNF
jgi:hypothetical protein